ncbi:MAG: 50S ribosomal protein L23 [Chloroflexi bacterium]|nr:50S ribosomal protein L23 [Chloroflexota bacterium]
MHISEVLLRPTITEKSTLLQEEGQYTFAIAPKANKTLVKQAVEENFNVTVISVNITRNHGKRKRYGPRYKKQPDVKKAVVTLQAGDRIELIEGL